MRNPVGTDKRKPVLTPASKKWFSPKGPRELTVANGLSVVAKPVENGVLQPRKIIRQGRRECAGMSPSGQRVLVENVREVDIDAEFPAARRAPSHGLLPTSQ